MLDHRLNRTAAGTVNTGAYAEQVHATRSRLEGVTPQDRGIVDILKAAEITRQGFRQLKGFSTLARACALFTVHNDATGVEKAFCREDTQLHVTGL